MIRKGNHAVQRRMTHQGMAIAVESDKGQERHWRDSATGESGTTKMRYPYGYFEGTKASGLSGDGMALDVYVGPDEDAEEVYVIQQMKKPSFEDKDELKVMVGFGTEKQARAVYLSHYNDERFLGSCEAMKLEAFKDKFITPHVSKALDVKDPGLLLSTAAGTSAIQSPNTSGVPIPMQPDQPMPMRTPGAPGMGGLGQLVPPMPMMPPPVDVDTLEGVKSLLNQIGGMKDGQLLSTVDKIWGPGYQFVNATSEHIRCEIRGFLLDQRDLLQTRQDMQDEAMQTLQIPPPSPISQGPMSSPFLPQSNGMQQGAGAVLAVVNLPQPASTGASSNSSLTQKPSSSPLNEDSQRSEFIPMSSGV